MIFLRRLPAAAAILAAAALLSSCGLNSGDVTGISPGNRGSAAPDIAEVDVAEDVRAWQGVVHPAVGETAVNPVAESPRQQLPVTLVDAQDNVVTVKDASRVLALDLYGTLSRTVYELGLGATLVGRDRSTAFPEAAALPLVTPQGHDLSAEAILALDPSLVISDSTLDPEVIEQIGAAGVTVVWTSASRSLDNVSDITRQVARALGVPAAGRRLVARIERDVDEVTAKIDAVAPSNVNERLRAVFLYVRGGAGVYYMFGEGAGADGLIDAVGAYDVADEIGIKGMQPANAEGLIAAGPEVVIMMTGGLESAGGVDGLLEKLPALAQTPAGRNKRIITVDDSVILGYGPHTAKVLNALAVAVLAPQAIE